MINIQYINISTYTTFCIFQYGGATCTRHIIDMSYLGVIDVYGWKTANHHKSPQITPGRPQINV